MEALVTLVALAASNTFPWRPVNCEMLTPYWITHLQSYLAVLPRGLLKSWTQKNAGSRWNFDSHLDPKYISFRFAHFGGRHIGFSLPVTAAVLSTGLLKRWNPKIVGSLWNCDSTPPRSRYISVSVLVAAILDFSLPVTYDSIADRQVCWKAEPLKLEVARPFEKMETENCGYPLKFRLCPT